jgi:hypothetical protein
MTTSTLTGKTLPGLGHGPTLWNSRWKDGSPLTIRVEIRALFETGSYTDMEHRLSDGDRCAPDRPGSVASRFHTHQMTGRELWTTR